MSIPPHRAPGDLGHIEDHNAIVDVLTGNDGDIASVTQGLSEHIAAEDPHGDRAWADGRFAQIDHTHDFPVSSVNGGTGDIVLGAADIGAETPTGAQSKVDALGNDLREDIDAKIDESRISAPDGVAPLGTDGFIPNEFIPSLTGSNKITVSEEEPVDPADGDIWINPSEAVAPPLSGAPAVFRTDYEGPRKVPTTRLPESGEFGSFDPEDWPPLVFTTGPTGYTEITMTISLTNNASDNSTTLITYSMVGDQIGFPLGWGQGVYQGPRAANNTIGVKITGFDTWDLPPNTEVTLGPGVRLSTTPSAAAQNNEELSGRIFQVDTAHPCFISVRCW